MFLRLLFLKVKKQTNKEMMILKW